ncbi:MAG: RtcB family protein [Candidatus Moranbacteria bacterium]|nr:RtcB family protein [Candidatus Moranbacteria bacterium]
MPYQLKNISEHKKELKTSQMQVPAVFHTSDALMPNDDTISEIELVAKQPGVFHHVAVMSDVHSKKGRKNPTGTVVASEFLMPQINDTAPNCGMRFLKTNLTDEDLANGNLDKLFNELVKVIPTKAYVGTKVSYSLIMDICRKGMAPVKEFFKSRTKNEIENSYKNGNFFHLETEFPSEQDILNAIPKLFLKIGKYRLGILGAAGNHFLDLMKISEIQNPEIAEKFGLKNGQYIFVIHTGSGLLGQYASYLYTPKNKEHLSQKIVLELGKMFFKTEYQKETKELYKKFDEYKNKEEYFTYDENTTAGKMFITAHRVAANQGFANRSIITNNLDQAIEKTLGKNPQLDMLFDKPHVYVEKENHFGHNVWVHRNGAVSANGPSRMNHPLFSQTGEPLIIPSSMSTPAYLCVGTDENESTFFSASHGTGRRKDPESDKVIDKIQLLEKMEKKNVKLFNAKSSGVVLQDSGYYKDVEEVVKGMVENEIIKVVAKMEPVAVLMY